MRATTRDIPAADAMDETVAYEHDSQVDQSGLDRPTGSSDMPTPAPTPGQHRYTYSSGARPLDGYTIKRAIGRGGFGEVYYATSDSGKEVALKLVVRNLEVERRGVVQCMNLKCPNLLTVFDLKSNDAGDSFVIMEYVAGPSLAHVLSRHPHGMPAAEVRAWLKGLVEGVAYLHDHGIVHRDLKPANLFMEEGLVKIGDYGLAKLINASQGNEHSESIGTCHYMAPEIASGKYHKPIDVYAIGVIIYEMLTGRVPFDGETVGEVLMKHLTARPDTSMLAEPYRSIVSKALAKDPSLRPQRVYDLLPPDDAPTAPSVRFIGDGKTAPRLPEPPAATKPIDDGILRIGAEDSVFYIGPDTRPPRAPRPPITDRFRAGVAALRRSPEPPAPPRAARPQPQPQPQPRPQVIPQPKPQRPAPAPPEPPAPLPSGRVRLAELAGSMVLAAPVAAALAIPTALLMAVDPLQQPEVVAFLFGLGLLGAWANLIPAKLFEGRRGALARRASLLASGAAVGLAGALLATVFDLADADRAFYPGVGPGAMPFAGAATVYFALLPMAGGWGSLTARDRKSRFRLWPLLRTTAAGGLLALALPFPQPWGLGAAVLTAAATQFVSPWDKKAAVYARYAARAAKRGRKTA